ncbi:hypothetical protein N7495_003031 [Penicillium taxi]|uniref:uncharacterized protein n=1 Tax=Penicillium taxi TaxID=168475 RepID=UPI0025450F45|nr:uncharacterized protein N7495_003031 [Penicillium taxi]KAJ5902503.1 hypothetical protein N7495_003031 [Penicillium taxi]
MTLSTQHGSRRTVPYVNYEWATENTYNFIYTYDVIVCMLVSSAKFHWKMTHNRQDFSRVVYLNTTVYDEVSLFEITVNTTSGYFELPNYIKDNTPGPLLGSMIGYE